MTSANSPRTFSVVTAAGLCAVLLTGCGPPTIEVIHKEPSPDGRLVAYAEAIDSHGGATVGYSYRVVVVPSDRHFDVNNEDDWIWEAYVVYPSRIAWRSEHTLDVVVRRQGSPHLDTIRTRERLGVNANLVLVD